jgi:hypothetical protein
MAGDLGEMLLESLRQISSERGYRQSHERPASAEPTLGGRANHPGASLSARDEAFVAAMRQALTELAGAIGMESLDRERQRAVQTALDGAELVTRGQLAMESPEQLRMLLPSFVFLVSLPIVEQDEALALSRRAGTLVDQHLDN